MLSVYVLLPSIPTVDLSIVSSYSLHMLHDEVRHPFELELSWISEETKWQHHLVPDNLRDEVNEWAVQSIKEDEMDDDEDED